MVHADDGEDMDEQEKLYMVLKVVSKGTERYLDLLNRMGQETDK